MTDKEERNPSIKTGAASTLSNTGGITSSGASGTAKDGKQRKAVKKVKPEVTIIANSGAQIVDAAKNDKGKKIDKEPTSSVPRKPSGEKNTLEFRVDYVCNFLNIKKEQMKEQVTLDFCLDDIGRMDWIFNFSNLKELVLIRQGITNMEGLDRLRSLEKCWLSHNFIDQIRSLDKSRNLKELYLGGNKITSTHGLERCVSLEQLWLDNNRIDSIKGMGSLDRLEHLNLAGNAIEQIGIGLDGLVSLSHLNMAANKIGNFKEVLNLNRLPCLSATNFNDPHYGDNPICNLCNYSTYVLYHLPRLHRLDTEVISDDSKNFAEGTFMKKRMYYNMRIKTIQRNTSNIMKLIKICRKVRNFKIDIQVSKLTRKLNEIQRELEERQNLPRESSHDFQTYLTYGPENLTKNPLDAIDNDRLISDIDSKKALISGRLHDKNEDLKDLQTIYESLRKKVYDMSEQNIHRLMTELETGGNIRFEEGKPSDKWFSSCVDLVRSRFNSEQMKFFGIQGIQVSRVTRIHNRFLRNRFEEKLEQLVDLSDNSYKRNLEYLFYGVDPAQSTELHRAMEEGFRTQQEYDDTALPNCIPLVNSVASAELARINCFFQAEDGYAQMRSAAKAQKQSNLRENQELTVQKGLVQIPSGQLLVCKVFLSKCVPDINQSNFNPSHSPSEIWKYAPVDTKMYSHVSSIFRSKENDPKQKLWFVFDNALVLPEYLVEFDYLTTNQSASDIKKVSDVNILNQECNKLFSSVNETQRVLENTYIRYGSKEKYRLQNVHIHANDLDRSDMGCLKKPLHQLMTQCHIKELMDNYCEFQDDDTTQTAIENSMPPDIPMRSQLDEMNDNIIRSVCKEVILENIMYLNLFNNKIKKIQGLNGLTNLKTLVLSFNELEDMDGIQNCNNLVKLDLHNNFIRTIKNLEGKDKITYLDMTHNWVSEWSLIEYVGEQCQNLKEFGMRCNPLATKKNYRSMVSSRAKQIMKLDGVLLSEKDKVQLDEEDKVLSIQLIMECSKDQRKGYEQAMQHTIDSHDDEQSPVGRNFDWESQIELLNLSHQKVTHITNLEMFINLRKLNLMDNNIIKIMNLESCKLLEELSLEKNKIKTIENLSHLKYLKRLDLGQNLIQRIQNINQLESLTQLSLEDNRIQKLSGFEEMQTLMELYLGNNQIEDIKEIINLKELQRLIILDIQGNTLIKEDNYRIYCIFHLRRLRVLDGQSIENPECIEAKETFAGRMTQEILDAKLMGNTMQNVKELDLTGCKLRDFDRMFDREFCPNLRELNLSHNFLATLRGFGYLPQLKILKMKQNRLESLFCKLNEDGYPRGLFGLHGLEVLDVSYNSLHDLYGLHLAPMKELKILHASNNEITKADFLEKLKQLRELDLSKNRIKQIESHQFHSELMISCLKIEDNNLRSLANIERLTRLHAFHGGGNRLAEFWEVDRLQDLQYLMEISLANNPMTRKPQYRQTILKKLLNLIVLDGKEILMEERVRTEGGQPYDQQKMPPMIHFQQYPQSKLPVKLNSVNFDGVFNQMKQNPGEHTNQPNAGPQKHLNAVQGFGLNPNSALGTGDMQGLIQVQSMNNQGHPMQMMGHNFDPQKMRQVQNRMAGGQIPNKQLVFQGQKQIQGQVGINSPMQTNLPNNTPPLLGVHQNSTLMTAAQINKQQQIRMNSQRMKDQDSSNKPTQIGGVMQMQGGIPPRGQIPMMGGNRPTTGTKKQ